MPLRGRGRTRRPAPAPLSLRVARLAPARPGAAITTLPGRPARNRRHAQEALRSGRRSRTATAPPLAAAAAIARAVSVTTASNWTGRARRAPSLPTRRTGAESRAGWYAQVVAGEAERAERTAAHRVRCNCVQAHRPAADAARPHCAAGRAERAYRHPQRWLAPGRDGYPAPVLRPDRQVVGEPPGRRREHDSGCGARGEPQDIPARQVGLHRSSSFRVAGVWTRPYR